MMCGICTTIVGKGRGEKNKKKYPLLFKYKKRKYLCVTPYYFYMYKKYRTSYKIILKYDLTQNTKHKTRIIRSFGGSCMITYVYYTYSYIYISHTY